MRSLPAAGCSAQASSCSSVVLPAPDGPITATCAVQPVAVNRQGLQQVLVNLLVNAAHAMPQGGRLDLATRDAGAEVHIVVTDTVPGLAPAVLARLFQPFATGKPDGTGLGLWISRGIVERYGGDIRAANRDDATAGACFTVVLRAEPPAGRAEGSLRAELWRASSALIGNPTVRPRCGIGCRNHLSYQPRAAPACAAAAIDSATRRAISASSFANASAIGSRVRVSGSRR